MLYRHPKSSYGQTSQGGTNCRHPGSRAGNNHRCEHAYDMVNRQQLQSRLYGPEGDGGEEGTWKYKKNSGHTAPKSWYNAGRNTCCQDTYSGDRSTGSRKAMQKGMPYRHPKGRAGNNNSNDQAYNTNESQLQHSLYGTSGVGKVSGGIGGGMHTTAKNPRETNMNYTGSHCINMA
eukprot:5637625-Heterocapsa_arctica.AAC.1